jgi:hypothetical protein
VFAIADVCQSMQYCQQVLEVLERSKCFLLDSYRNILPFRPFSLLVTHLVTKIICLYSKSRGLCFRMSLHSQGRQARRRSLELCLRVLHGDTQIAISVNTVKQEHGNRRSLCWCNSFDTVSRKSETMSRIGILTQLLPNILSMSHHSRRCKCTNFFGGPTERRELSEVWSQSMQRRFAVEDAVQSVLSHNTCGPLWMACIEPLCDVSLVTTPTLQSAVSHWATAARGRLVFRMVPDLRDTLYGLQQGVAANNEIKPEGGEICLVTHKLVLRTQNGDEGVTGEGGTRYHE